MIWRRAGRNPFVNNLHRVKNRYRNVKQMEVNAYAGWSCFIVGDAKLVAMSLIKTMPDQNGEINEDFKEE